MKRIKISATLSGLKLEADLQNVHASATHREKVKGKTQIFTSLRYKLCMSFWNSAPLKITISNVLVFT